MSRRYKRTKPSVYLHEITSRKLKQVAEANQLSFSSTVNKILEDGLSSEDAERFTIEEIKEMI